MENHLSFHTYWLYLASLTLRNWYLLKCMEKQGEWTTRAVILLSLFFLFCFKLLITTSQIGCFRLWKYLPRKIKSFLQKPVASIASNTHTESRLTNQQRSSSSSSSYSDSQPMRQDVTNQVQQPIREAVTESKLSIPSASPVHIHGIMSSEL
mgnify:CR=1 FL=1